MTDVEIVRAGIIAIHRELCAEAGQEFTLSAMSTEGVAALAALDQLDLDLRLLAMRQTAQLGNTQFRGGVLEVDLWYPRFEDPARTPDHPVTVQVGLSDVRAADSIQIDYDFERDGYSIKQASKFEWEFTDAVCDRDWQEVAFVQAWGREAEPDESAGTT